MRMRLGLVVLVAVIVIAIPATAVAAEAAKPETYDLTFTLPTAGMSGCQVCHGDPNLTKSSEVETSSIHVDSELLSTSAHPEQPCTVCHTDFALSTPHDNIDDDEAWRSIAQTSCQSCKDHGTQRDDYTGGAHTPVLTPGMTQARAESRRVAQGKPAKVPTCGGCHGGHFIASKEDSAAQAAFQRDAIRVCGECHADRSENYTDYYHGAAYRRGAADAPACWDCHGAHRVLPASNNKSPINPQHLVETCGGENCHVDVTDEFVSEYAPFIHGRPTALSENPILAVYQTAKQGVVDALQKIASLFD